jgi:hypothetical protein
LPVVSVHSYRKSDRSALTTFRTFERRLVA